jgi:ABC-type transport system involved in cytochrome bd biosynthesis fused ATPase/permease subunit
MKTLKDRWSAKTPTFWKKVQRVGLVAGALGAAIIAAPVALPAALITASGYLVTAGGVAAALSQLTKEDK